MALLYGNTLAKRAVEAQVWCATSRWTALQTGSAPLSERAWIEIQVKGSTALALAYANKDGNGNFTAPTDDTRAHLVIPRNTIKVVPLGDSVTLYGRALAKAGNTNTGTKVIVAEFA